MQQFSKTTKLHNISGRGDYISNPDRQEKIVAESSRIDWQPYAEFEKANRKTNVRNNEGREFMGMLPNSWAKLPKDELIARGHQIAKEVLGKETDYQFAFHWNKTYSNFHIHIVYSERQKIEKPGVWDRDIYLTNDGKVARRKADRARDKAGNILPPVHRKGEQKAPFTAKDKKYRSRLFTTVTSKEIFKRVLESYGVKFEKPAPLHQIHVGKGPQAEKFSQINEIIKANNHRLDVLEAAGVPTQKAITELKKHLKKKITPVLYIDDNNKLHITTYITPAKALEHISKTHEKFNVIEAAIFEQNQKPATERAKTPEKTSNSGLEREKVMPAEPAKVAEKAKPAATRAEKLMAAFDSFMNLYIQISALFEQQKNLKKPPRWQTKNYASYKANYEKYETELNPLRDKIKEPLAEMENLGVDTDIISSPFKTPEQKKAEIEKRCVELNKEDFEKAGTQRTQADRKPSLGGKEWDASIKSKRQELQSNKASHLEKTLQKRKGGREFGE